MLFVRVWFIYALLLLCYNAELIRLEISPYTVGCLTSIPTQCLEVRENNDEEYITFKGRIQGFVPIQGLRTFLVVEKAVYSNPPPGDSNIIYTMIRVIISYRDEIKPSLPDPNPIKLPRAHYLLPGSSNTLNSHPIPNLNVANTILTGDWFLVQASTYPIEKPSLVRFVDQIIIFTYCNARAMNYKRIGSSVQITPGYESLDKCPDIVPSESIVNECFRKCSYLKFDIFQVTCVDINNQLMLKLVR